MTAEAAGTGSEQYLRMNVCMLEITHKSFQGFIDLQLGIDIQRRYVPDL